MHEATYLHVFSNVNAVTDFEKISVVSDTDFILFVNIQWDKHFPSTFAHFACFHYWKHAPQAQKLRSFFRGRRV